MSRLKVSRPLFAVALAALLLAALPSVAGAGEIPTNELTASWTEGTTTAVPGTTATFTLVLSNDGENAPAEVSPTFDVGTIGTWTCTVNSGTVDACTGTGGTGPFLSTPTFLGDGTITYSIQVIIPAAATGTITGQVIVPAAGPDDAPADNTASDTDTLTPQADLSITKTDGVTAVQADDEVTYTIIASNAGPSDAPSATVVDNIPANLDDATWTCVGAGGGVCTGAGAGSINDATVVLPAGASVTYTLEATVDSDADGGDEVVNTATVSSATTDLVGPNNTATDTDDVADFTADLVALKTGPATATVGGTISYTIGVRNDGPDLAREVVLSDLLPTGTTFVSMTQTTGPTATVVTPAVGTHGSVSASWDELADDAAASFTLVVQLGNTIVAGGSVTNTATVDSTDDPEEAQEVSAAATVDPVDNNNAASVNTAIQAPVTTTTPTTLAATTTVSVGAGALARTGSSTDGPTGMAFMILGGGLVLVGAAELRRRRAIGG